METTDIQVASLKIQLDIIKSVLTKEQKTDYNSTILLFLESLSSEESSLRKEMEESFPTIQVEQLTHILSSSLISL
ncbi:hypothetical protein D3C87_35330 [compost metagenome]